MLGKTLKEIVSQLDDNQEIDLFHYVYSGGGDEQTIQDFDLFLSPNGIVYIVPSNNRFPYCEEFLRLNKEKASNYIDASYPY